MFAFLQSLAEPVLKFVVRMTGNCAGMGVPVGDVAVEAWETYREKKAEADRRSEFEQVVQQQKEWQRQVSVVLDQIAVNQPESVKQQAATYLNMVPGTIQRTLRRPEDPSGLTVPPQMRIQGPMDLQRILPDRMPRFKAGDCPVAGTDLVLEEFLGAGGFGEVWRAAHRRRPHSPPVALKFCTDPVAAKSLHREVELLDRVAANKGRLKNIVELKYAHLQADPPCLEYEYVGDGDLADLLVELHGQGKAAPGVITELMLQLASAVASAHDIQPPIIHRDLKPANVLVHRTGDGITLKVADFGIGGVATDRALTEARRVTETGGGNTSSTAYTPIYASPQQRSGRPVDARDDVYALGVIWHQLLLADFTSEAPRGSAWKRRLAERGLSAGLIELLELCVEDRAEDRPANAVIVADRLSDGLFQVTVHTPTGSS